MPIRQSTNTRGRQISADANIIERSMQTRAMTRAGATVTLPGELLASTTRRSRRGCAPVMHAEDDSLDSGPLTGSPSYAGSPLTAPSSTVLSQEDAGAGSPGHSEQDPAALNASEHSLAGASSPASRSTPTSASSSAGPSSPGPSHAGHTSSVHEDVTSQVTDIYTYFN